MANKTLAEEELDRELILRHDTHAYGNGQTFTKTTKAKVGKKTLTISDRGDSITFKKRAKTSMRDELSIETLRSEVVYETCNLGHRHEKTKNERVYQWFYMDWEHVESLVSWLNDGSWTEVRPRENPSERVLKECLEFIDEVGKRDALLKPMAQKLKVKIKNLGIE